MILNIQHVANWKAITERKQKLINKNTAKENAKWLRHTYKINDQVLVERHQARKLERPYNGPYTITEVFTNGTVTIKKGAVYERINIRRIRPYNC
jgi:hypothetical protein